VILLGGRPGHHPLYSVVWNDRWRKDATDPEYHLVDLRRPMARSGLPVGSAHLLRLDHHDSVRFAALRIASYALWPFGRTIVEKPGPRPGALIGNVIWVILFGIWLAIGHVISAVAMAITIIGIPLALANLKLIPVSLFPLGKEIVPTDQARSLSNSSRAVG